MAYQQQQCPLGWLLKNLEQRVRTSTIEFVDRIDDRDPPATLACGRAEERNRPAHVVNRDLLPQHAFLVRRALQNEKIAVRLRRHAACHRMLPVDGERRRRVNGRRSRIRMREHKARQAISERGLADALLAYQHKSVRHAAAAVGGKECTFSTAVTEELVGYPRWRGFVDVGFVRTHEVASAKRTGAVAGRRRAFTACQMCFATVIFGALASTMTQRCGSPAASIR